MLYLESHGKRATKEITDSSTAHEMMKAKPVNNPVNMK